MKLLNHVWGLHNPQRERDITWKRKKATWDVFKYFFSKQAWPRSYHDALELHGTRRKVFHQVGLCQKCAVFQGQPISGTLPEIESLRSGWHHLRCIGFVGGIVVLNSAKSRACLLCKHDRSSDLSEKALCAEKRFLHLYENVASSLHFYTAHFYNQLGDGTMSFSEDRNQMLFRIWHMRAIIRKT